jgi:hypothetical protein
MHVLQNSPLYELLMDAENTENELFLSKGGLKRPKFWNFTYLEDICNFYIYLFLMHFFLWIDCEKGLS